MRKNKYKTHETILRYYNNISRKREKIAGKQQNLKNFSKKDEKIC